LTLEQQDRAALAGPLGEVATALHFELLRTVYKRYPDLRPPSDEEPSCSPSPCPRPTSTN
jgi:hypothetical protein